MRRALPPPRRPALSRGTAAAEPAQRAAARTVGGSSACRSASPVRSSLLLVAPMALAVFGDLLLHAAPYPRFIGVHLRAPVGRGLCLDAAHGSFPPGATVTPDAAGGGTARTRRRAQRPAG